MSYVPLPCQSVSIGDVSSWIKVCCHLPMIVWMVFSSYESLTKNVPCPLRYGHTYLNKGDRLIESNLLMTNGPHTSSHPNQKLVYFPHEIPRMQSSGCVNKCINKLFYNMHFR